MAIKRKDDIKAKPKPASTEKPKVGRPRIDLAPYYEEIIKLLKINCTDEEICSFLGISTDTYGRRKKDDPDFAEILTKGRDEFKISLRRMQYQTAANGHAGMQIFLGKNYLGQSDNPNQPITEAAPRETLRIDLDGIGSLFVDEHTDPITAYHQRKKSDAGE